ncbi:MAG: anthranilate synthase component I [Armatimonadota bacterium]
MHTPSLEQFLTRCEQGNLVPVYREILADLETPVSAFLKIGGGANSFLLESVAGGEQIGRYSFIAGDPSMVVKTKGREVEIRREGRTETRTLADGEDPLHLLKELMRGFRFVADPELPPFCGGAVGFLSYDTVRFFERLPDLTPDDRGLPDTYFVFTDTLLIFDHVKHRIKVLCLARVGSDPRAAYAEAVEKIERLVAQLKQPLPHPETEPVPREEPLEVTSIPSREEHEAAVLRAKEYIAAGDIIQVVLSRRMEAKVRATPFEVYRALRSVNPSPYMFFLQFEDCQLIGASPETLVTEREGSVVTRPIAGTIRRGKTLAEDAELEAELLANPKERAEHIMLVDLHRNDIGRVCEYGSVHVDQLMVTEKYSHVIHIVSNVVGRLRPEKDAYDLIRAAFPAGTLSGAPKIRAMQIIEELEPVKRGPYGGVIGYFSYNGNMDTAITLRTIVMQNGTAYIQAGGGIVADSDPEAEYQETVNKAGALLRAVELAERGLE